eukprot:3686852-Amphidinium_carterae.1
MARCSKSGASGFHGRALCFSGTSPLNCNQCLDGLHSLNWRHVSRRYAHQTFFSLWSSRASGLSKDADRKHSSTPQSELAEPCSVKRRYLLTDVGIFTDVTFLAAFDMFDQQCYTVLERCAHTCEVEAGASHASEAVCHTVQGLLRPCVWGNP